MKLIGEGTYERVWKVPDDPPEKHPVFILRKLTAGEVNQMDDQITVLTGQSKETKLSLLVGTARRLKIQLALMSWRNVELEDGQDASCTNENKEKLPADVQAWLENDIDEMNALKGVSESERKNS